MDVFLINAALFGLHAPQIRGGGPRNSITKKLTKLTKRTIWGARTILNQMLPLPDPRRDQT